MSQLARLYELLSDQQPHSTFEIVRKVYDMDETTIARLAARVYDCKRVYGVRIDARRDRHNPKMWWYQLNPVKNPVSDQPQPQKETRPSEPPAARGELFNFSTNQHGEMVADNNHSTTKMGNRGIK